jgi:hypothetical protein
VLVAVREFSVAFWSMKGGFNGLVTLCAAKEVITLEEFG